MDIKDNERYGYASGAMQDTCACRTIEGTRKDLHSRFWKVQLWIRDYGRQMLINDNEKSRYKSYIIVQIQCKTFQIELP